MTDKSKEILAYLKDHYGEWFSKYELVEALDTTMAVVNGSVQGLLKKVWQNLVQKKKNLLCMVANNQVK